MARTKNELVKCPYCGEMYSVTYKHCPFCNEDGTGGWDDPDSPDELEETVQRGGKRLAGAKGPSVRTIIGAILSLALIIAAIGIVFSIIHSTLGRGKTPSVETSTGPAAESTLPSDDPVESGGAEVVDPVESQPVIESIPPVESEIPTAVTSVAPGVAPTAFTLNREDFTLDHAGETFQMAVRFTPADATAQVSWRSSDPNIASISWDGYVIAVSRGTVTLTATVEGLGEKTCICRCNFTGGTTSTSVPSAAPTVSAADLKLNREDFTLGYLGETFRMVVSGTSSAVTWTSSNTSVATIAADGTVTAVGRGNCTVTATVDGVTLKCIVRCNW